MILSNPVQRTSDSTAHNRPVRKETIAEDAENRLRANAYLALKNISCEYREGVLTLRGSLPTYYLKQIAQEVVAATDGVARIENQIEVCAPACHVERPGRPV